ncbi:Fc receptor-like protein 3 isoform X5 [Crocuta crocuta]
MLLWLLLLILAPGQHPAGALPKALLLLKPPWSTTFKGEAVTLICKDHHPLAQESISWYHNGRHLENQSEKIKIKTSGYYSCKTQRSSLSNPVHVQFLTDWLILQASHPVFEGDPVVLRCRGKKEEEIMEKSYYKNKKIIQNHYNSNITVYPPLDDDSTYHCTASREFLWYQWIETSNSLKIQVQELFPSPVLTASPSQPIEGSPMTLKCETWLPPQRTHIRLQFCFFKENQLLGFGWSNSPEFHIPTMWSEDSVAYWCLARTTTSRIMKTSPRSQIHVQRIPVSDVNLETEPPVGQLIEGEDLVLICSAAEGTGTVMFSWHREGLERSLGRKTRRALSAELRIASMREQNAGRYYCAADNMDGPILSKRIRITLRKHSGNYSCEANNSLGVQRSEVVSLSIMVPVSRPVFTLNPAVAQIMVGDVLELRCEVQRGSPPILYWFYHEDVILENTSAPFGGGASFNLSLTTEHSGNYSCGADNGLGAQRSEAVSLNVTGLFMNKVTHITVGVFGWLLSMLGLAATAALVGRFRSQRKSGGAAAPAAHRSNPNEYQKSSWSGPSRTGPQWPTHSEPSALMELQPMYSNVSPGDDNLVYSKIQSGQHRERCPAHSARTQQKAEEPVVIYSEVKKAHPDGPAGQNQEAAADCYENVPCMSLALGY